MYVDGEIQLCRVSFDDVPRRRDDRVGVKIADRWRFVLGESLRRQCEQGRQRVRGRPSRRVMGPSRGFGALALCDGGVIVVSPRGMFRPKIPKPSASEIYGRHERGANTVPRSWGG